MQNTEHIAKLRSASQRIASSRTLTPREVVSWFGAMQAQDYPAAKWAIAARAGHTADQDMERLITEKQLIRTWPMRGTIHFVLPEDAHWMLELMRGRVAQKFSSRHTGLGLTSAHFDKAASVLKGAMRGKRLTRKQMYDVLTAAGLDVEGQRLYHTIVYLAHSGLLAITSLEGKQPTFVWFDDWFPEEKRRKLDRTAALAQMAQYYVQSHGPVTVHDFAWWTGLTVADSREAFSLLGAKIVQLPDAPAYWMVANGPAVKDIPDSVFLAPSFDESIVALKDRSAIIGKEDFLKLTPYTNGMFNPVVLVNGQFAGIWKRIQKPKGIIVECDLSHRLTHQQKSQLGVEAEQYAAYLGQPLLKVDITDL